MNCKHAMIKNRDISVHKDMLITGFLFLNIYLTLNITYMHKITYTIIFRFDVEKKFKKARGAPK